MTSLYPSRYGAGRGGRGGYTHAHPDTLLLSEILYSEGYRTAGMTGSYIVSSRYGLEQGYETYRHPYKAAGFESSPVDAPEVAKWLQESRDSPFFLFRRERCQASGLKRCQASGLGWAGLKRCQARGLGWAGLGWAGGRGARRVGWAGLGWAGLGWLGGWRERCQASGLGWAGLGWAGLGREEGRAGGAGSLACLVNPASTLHPVWSYITHTGTTETLARSQGANGSWVTRRA